MADISLGAGNGPAAVRWVRSAVRALRPLRPLCLAVKALLREQGLNEVFTGGLSSYSLVNMVRGPPGSISPRGRSAPGSGGPALPMRGGPYVGAGIGPLRMRGVHSAPRPPRSQPAPCTPPA